MIKRISFASSGADVATEEFADAWRTAVAVPAGAPPDLRPLRIAVCTALVDELDGAGQEHDGVGIEWFADADHVERFEAWAASSDAADEVAASAGPVRAGPVVVADELVIRGADWLDQRWRDGGTVFKHMAAATRAVGLTPAKFAERWRSGSGRVSKPGHSPVVIPDEARGLAYVQNHPCPRGEGEWAYDAVNEVYFDDLDLLRTRVAWFRDEVGADAERDLIAQNRFLLLREEVLLPSA